MPVRQEQEQGKDKLQNSPPNKSKLLPDQHGFEKKEVTTLTCSMTMTITTMTIRTMTIAMTIMAITITITITLKFGEEGQASNQRNTQQMTITIIITTKNKQ